RDKLVTGVQTCALPICVGSYVNYVNAPAFGIPQSGWESLSPTGVGYGQPGCPLYIENTNVINTTMYAPADAFTGQFLNPLPNGRSEERRVGKECRERMG